jgi:putative membrane protein
MPRRTARQLGKELKVMSNLPCALVSVIVLSAFGLAFAQDQNYPNHNQQPDRTLQANPNSTPHEKGIGDTDKTFIHQAAIGDRFEIEMGQIAERKASSPAVKSFAGRMIKDHSANDDKLKNIAESQHISLPAELDPQHNNQKENLSKLSGAKFDQEYMLLMVQDHQKTVSEFEREAAHAEDPTVKNYAAASLPVLESHLNEAKQVENKVKQ